jgi:hypothetical protein
MSVMHFKSLDLIRLSSVTIRLWLISNCTRERIAAKMKGSPALVVAALLLTTYVFTGPAIGRTAAEGAVPAAKIRSFEVLGIHLGMTPTQVGVALAKQGFSLTSGIDPTVKNDLTHSGLCVNDDIAALRAGKPVSASLPQDTGEGGKCVYWQQPAYQGNVLSWPHLLIYYCEDYPAQPGVMRVVEISVGENPQTDADAKAFRQAIFARIGRKPTWESKDQTNGAYCSLNNYSPDFGTSPCPTDPTILEFNPGVHDLTIRQGVTLEYSAYGHAIIQDRDFIIAHRTFAWKAIQATHSPVKAPF